MYSVINQIQIDKKKVFIRVDYNVPLADGKIADDRRIAESLPTIEHALSREAKIILGSHLGRPKGVSNPGFSLLPVAEHLSDLLGRDVIFPEDCVGDAVKKLAGDLREGEIMLLENLRFHPEEEKNDPHFSKQLAQLAEVYIDDAFGVMHRAHASTAGMVSHFKEKGIGFLVKKEIEYLQGLLSKPAHPFLAIFGGAKVSDKIGVIENLMNHVDVFIIGGGMAYTFLKARGVDIGQSIVDEAKIHQAEKILKRAEIKGVQVLLPVDSVLASDILAGVKSRVANNGEKWDGLKALDIGPQTIAGFAAKIRQAKTILWNGPMGVFEVPDFEKGTFEIARAVGESGACAVVGGGDSVLAIRRSGIADKMAHLSTGGGAMMEFLEGKTLPGLKVLEA
ncbi:MAG: phosphoglycerate kinase [Deltaproteobacteria bacterium]|nr:phosphoglycerate kinase [Deltaproteobacteria bacterium]